MKFKNIRLIYIKNILLFLLFGFIIALATSYIQYSVKYEDVKNKIQNDSFIVSNRIENRIKEYTNKVEISLDSIQTNKLFKNYLDNSNKKNSEISNYLFINTMKNNKNYFQLRFIDNKGKEKIRVERYNSTTFIVKESKLQNKSNRYYFKDTINNTKGKYWYSYLDLNIENKKLEYPLRPTLRVSTKVIHKGRFYGILIVNIELKPLLDEIRKDEHFNIYIIDNDGYFILNPEPKKQWARYLDTKYTIDSELPNFRNDSFGNYTFSLNKYFKNNENLKLILKVKDHYLTSLKENNRKLAYIIGLLTLLISIPISLIISVPISKLYMEFNKIYKENLKHIETIDKYVITMTVDINKKIVAVSKALCNISGYSKDELIGKTPSLFKSGNMDHAVYKDLWTKITNGDVWVGELENKTKDEKNYWIKSTILPNKEKQVIQNFTSISENINDKKIIEKISQMDKLTKIYNRMKLDNSLENEFHRFSRYNSIFSIILIDIDYFKLVNDTYGHQVGDKVLIQISKILKNSCRKTDIVGRWGGEEFMIICIDTGITGALKLSKNIKEKIENYNFDVVKHKTVSIGVSEVKDSDDIESIIKRVDSNLYKAKDSGRNKIIYDL